MRNIAAFKRRLLSTVIAALKVSFMPRFLARRIEHQLGDFVLCECSRPCSRTNPSRIKAVFVRIYCKICQLVSNVRQAM